jgi:hypothetical protein
VRRTGSVAVTWGTVVARIVGRAKPPSLPISPHDRNTSPTHAAAPVTRVSLQVFDGAFTLTTSRSAVRRLLAWPDINATADDGDAMASTSTCTLLATASIRFVSFQNYSPGHPVAVLFCLRGLSLQPSLSSQTTSLPITTLSLTVAHTVQCLHSTMLSENRSSRSRQARQGGRSDGHSWPGTLLFVGVCLGVLSNNAMRRSHQLSTHTLAHTHTHPDNLLLNALCQQASWSTASHTTHS